MSVIYRAILERRRDMTEWLIHFTRSSDCGSPRDVLLRILTEGALRPGFACRGDLSRPTVYGPVPAVCLTEQPIGAFIEYLRARNQPASMAGYGLLIHKHDVYVAGGMPAIYGLRNTVEVQVGEPGYELNKRILRSEYLPPEEQYRYLALAPTRTPYPLDWTHEREWRWPSSSSHAEDQVFHLSGQYRTDRGTFEGRVHALVDTDEDVGWLQQSMRHAYDQDEVGKLRWGWPWDYSSVWRDHLQKVSILSLATARRELAADNSAFYRFEEWPNGSTTPLLS